MVGLMRETDRDLPPKLVRQGIFVISILNRLGGRLSHYGAISSNDAE